MCSRMMTYLISYAWGMDSCKLRKEVKRHERCVFMCSALVTDTENVCNNLDSRQWSTRFVSSVYCLNKFFETEYKKRFFHFETATEIPRAQLNR